MFYHFFSTKKISEISTTFIGLHWCLCHFVCVCILSGGKRGAQGGQQGCWTHTLETREQ